jgi:Fe-S cluster assembly protein SufD
MTTEAIERTPATAFSREAVARLSALKGDPDWMRQKRFEAWLAYDSEPLPRWERTDIRKLNFSALTPIVEPRTPKHLDPDAAPQTGRTGGDLLHSEGTVITHSLDKSLADRGVIFTDLDTAVKKLPALVQKYFMTECVTPQQGKFQALSSALWNGGTFLYVPKNVEVELPIASRVSLESDGVAYCGHTIVVLERGAKVTFIESYGSFPATGDTLYDGITEAFVGDGAQLTHVMLQDWHRNVWDLSTRRVLLNRDASLVSVAVTLGGKLSKLNIETVLRGEGSNAEMKGLFIANRGQHLTHDTLQDHLVPHTTSDLLYKGALRGKSRSVFEGLIRVHRDGQKANAYQASRNLLLDTQARADALPMLEIGANDVRCTHGATVGPVDREHLFYLRTRGLSKLDAEQLIVRGFFDPVVRRIPIEDLRQGIWKRIEEEMVQP